MNRDPKLKAFIRLDGENRIVPSSIVYRKNMPKDGKWTEINSNICCAAPTTTLSPVPEGALVTLNGEYIKTLNDEFITI